MLLELLFVVRDVVEGALEGDVLVGTVARSLPLEAANILFEVALESAEVYLGPLLRALDLSIDLAGQFLVSDGHLVFEFPDLGLDDLVRLLDLEVSDLRAERLELLPDLLDQLAALLFVKLGWTCCHELDLLTSLAFLATRLGARHGGHGFIVG